MALFSCTGEVSLRNNNENGRKPVAVLVSTSDELAGNAGNHNTNTSTNVPGLYEVPVSQNRSQYETVVHPRTVG